MRPPAAGALAGGAADPAAETTGVTAFVAAEATVLPAPEPAAGLAGGGAAVELTAPVAAETADAADLVTGATTLPAPGRSPRRLTIEQRSPRQARRWRRGTVCSRQPAAPGGWTAWRPG